MDKQIASISSVVAALAAAASLAPREAEAGQFSMKNCTPATAVVCVYNSNDSSLAIAAEAERLNHGNGKKFKCATNRCKVFIGFSRADLNKIRNEALAMGVVGGLYAPGLAAGATTAVLAVSGAGAAAATGGVALVAAGATLGAVVAGVAISSAVRVNEVCEKVIRQVKKDHADKATKSSGLKGKHTLIMTRGQNNEPQLSISEANDCPST